MKSDASLNSNIAGRELKSEPPSLPSSWLKESTTKWVEPRTAFAGSDFTDVHSLAAKLSEKADPLSAFLATMSHELRTPMNAVLGMLDLTLETPLTDEQKDNLKVAKDAATNLLGLLNDILDLSKVEEGKLELVYEHIALADIAKELERQFKFVAESRGLDFSVNIAAGLPPIIEVDIHRLNQILKNFISNALKFTNKGGIYVDIYRPQSPFLSPEPAIPNE